MQTYFLFLVVQSAYNLPSKVSFNEWERTETLKGMWSEKQEGVYCLEEKGVDRKIMFK